MVLTGSLSQQSASYFYSFTFYCSLVFTANTWYSFSELWKAMQPFFQQHMFCSHHCLRQQQFCPLHLINCSGVSACLLGEQTDGTIPAAWPSNLVSLLSQSPLCLWSGQALCLPEWSLSTSLLHSSHDSTLLLIRNTSLFTPVKTLKPTWRREIWH